MKLFLYLFYSVIATVVDSALVWMLVRNDLTGLVAANTIGVVAGLVVHYALSLKSVFRAEHGTGSFLVYFATFLGGLALANGLIYWSYEYAFVALGENARLIASKGVSIVIPFFILYYVRKYLFARLQKKREEEA